MLGSACMDASTTTLQRASEDEARRASHASAPSRPACWSSWRRSPCVSFCLPQGYRGGSAAGVRQGRLRRRHRGLVRDHRAVPPSARAADPAHRDHPRAEGAAGSGARPVRRELRVHRGRGVAHARPLDLPGILRRFLSDPASTRPAAEALAALLPRAARDDRGRPRAPRARPHRAAHPRRSGRRA